MYWNNTALVPNMPSMPPAGPAAIPHKVQTINPFHIDVSMPHDAGALEVYLAITAAVVAVCIVGVAFVSRRRRSPALS